MTVPHPQGPGSAPSHRGRSGIFPSFSFACVKTRKDRVNQAASAQRATLLRILELRSHQLPQVCREGPGCVHLRPYYAGLTHSLRALFPDCEKHTP